MSKRQFLNRREWRAMSYSARRLAKKRYQYACAALDANTADEVETGVDHETPEYLRLNDDVIRAERNVPWWVAQIELHWRPRFTQRCSACKKLIWVEEPHVTVNWHVERFGRRGTTTVDDAVAVLLLCMPCKTRLSVDEEWVEVAIDDSLEMDRQARVLLRAEGCQR